MGVLSHLQRLLGRVLQRRALFPEAAQNTDSLGRLRLSREDVIRLIEAHGGPEGLDLSRYDLSGVNLSKLDLHGIVFGNFDIVEVGGIEVITGSANLEGAWLERANLRRANLGRTNLRRAHLYHAVLTEASLWAANAEGASFLNADLAGTDLVSAVLRDSSLRNANLRGANLYRADLTGAALSGEALRDGILQESLEGYREYFTRWYITPAVRERYERRQLGNRHREAMQIYQALKNVFLNGGQYDDASWSYVKERQMERKSFSPAAAGRCYGQEVPERGRFLFWRRCGFYVKYTVKWLLAWLTELTAGYGERPLRVVAWVAGIVLVFPLLYYWSNGIGSSTGAPVHWGDYFYYSLAAFSTIGFPDLVPINGAAKLLTSLEALLGISLLALLMFALGNRMNKS